MLKRVPTATIVQATWLLYLVVLAGCGGADEEKVVTVSGKVTDNGQPLTVGSEGMVRIEFRRLEDAGTGKRHVDSEGAPVGPDGLYELPVPPGEYAIVVQQLDPYPKTDKLAGVFPVDKFPLVKQIDKDEKIDIEISQYRKKGK